MRYFIRFGELPEDGRSRLWNAPNVYYSGLVGSKLPGVSVYEVHKRGGKWDIDTDNLNSGSGFASLSELLYRHIKDKSLPILLLTGKPVRWKDFSPEERKEFERFYPGKGATAYELEGTDGEPLLRDIKQIGLLDPLDITCEAHSYPKDFMESIRESSMQINEYAFRWRRNSGKAQSYYSSKKAGFPYMVITASTNLTDESASFILYKVNAKQLLIDWQTNQKNQRSGGDYDPKLAKLSTLLVRNEGGIEEFAQLYPWYVKDFKLENRAKLFEILVTKMHMRESEFSATFGDVQEQTRQETLDQFHNAYIMFPDTMRDARRKQMMSFLESVDSYLEPHGLGYLLEEGRIAFRPITRRAWGLYYPGVKSEIIISPTIPFGHEAIRTIIHELGHKLQYEFIVTTDMASVMDQFRAAHRTGDKVPEKSIPPEIWKAINTLGTTIEYVGTKKKWKANSPYKITSLPSRANHKVKLISINNPNFWLSGPPEFLGSTNYIVNGQKQEDPTELASVSSWFPTAYSRKEPWEWFCECFSYYLMGKLEGPPAEWMNNFLSKYRQ